jgi:hypothetical protein
MLRTESIEELNQILDEVAQKWGSNEGVSNGWII